MFDNIWPLIVIIKEITNAKDNLERPLILYVSLIVYFQTRRRVNHEKCKAIYNEDMERKIQFVLRKNRHEPFPGCH